MITKHTFMVVRYPTCRRVVLWEHHDEGENCEDVMCVHAMYEFGDCHSARSVYEHVRRFTSHVFDFDTTFRAAWRKRKEVEA